mgnify:CR=1 FL=1
MKRLAILGSTGSIGRSALAVVDAHPTRLSVVGLAAGRRADDLAVQISRYRPSIAALTSDDDLPALREAASKGATITTSGPDGLVAVATHPDVDIVLCASSGTAALEAVLAAIAAGKTHRARQQGSPRDGWRARDESRPRARRAAAAGRQRAQRDPPVPARASAGRGHAPDSHRVRWALPHVAGRRSWSTPRPTTRCGIRRGRWAARSRSTRPR